MPPLLFLTDPERTPRPWEQAGRLPPGAGVVLRWFGRDDSRSVGRRLAETCRATGLIFLVGADAALAEALDADGLHMPERDLGLGLAIRAEHPDWFVTGAVHSERALRRAAEMGCDAALLSPVFGSFSPSAGEPLGVERFQALVADAGLPVYALGGVTEASATALVGSSACGLAAVGAV